MVAVLLAAGIKAEKQSQEGRFSISTPQDSFSAAVRALNAQGYPRETFDSMGKVFKREGFVSSPLEERARLSHAMSQEIANTIANIDGVITARVHLVMPENNPLIDKPQPSAAAVFIKHRPDRDLQSQVTQIKALVVNSIEGLSYGNVTVALFPAEAMPVGVSAAASSAGKGAREVREARGSRESPALSDGAQLAAGGLGAIGALSLAAGLVLSWRRRETGDK
jgi:type III secretion protein J